MTAVQVILGAVLLQRLIELWIARRNTEKLLAQGAIEAAPEHYHYFVALHATWLAALVLFTPDGASPNLFWLAIFLVLQTGRIWVMASLGRLWTTRIVTLPGTPLIRTGPYRFLRHPNYLIVAGEIAALPLVFDQWEMALVFSGLNAMLLWVRIRAENEALAERRCLD
jgi:methyltransferase